MNRIANVIDAFQRNDALPPKSLISFVRWSLKGAWPHLALAAFFAALAGLFEIMSAYILGRVIDSVVESDPTTYFQENWLIILGLTSIFLFFRPLFFGLPAISNSVLVMPNVLPMTLSRLHRWTLGQSVTYFDNDFAGRIAQKQLQTASAIASVMSELISVGAFAIATPLGAVVYLFTIDLRIVIALICWIGVYSSILCWFLPRIRVRAKSRAGARATVSGQIVNTFTNIKTVRGCPR